MVLLVVLQTSSASGSSSNDDPADNDCANFCSIVRYIAKAAGTSW